MGSRLAHSFAAVSMLATLVAAQNVTVPAMLAGVEGGGGTNIPFGSNLACRYQCIYDVEELPWTGPRVITGILLRADNNLPLAAIAAKGFLDVSVLMSTTNVSAATASTDFAANRGVDATWVMTNQMIQLPAQPQLTQAGPRPANIPFVFQVPWAYGLTPATTGMPAPRNLLIEFHIHSQPSGSYRIDNFGGCTSPGTPFGQAPGAACRVGAQPVVLSGSPAMLAGEPYSWSIANGPATMPFLVLLDLTSAGGLFGNPAWPLPYPMFDPANPTQPSPALAALQWPATDCWINVNPVFAMAGVTDALGAGTVSTTLPAGRQVVGVPWYAQAFVSAPTANPLRLVTSEGFQASACGPLQVARIHAFYNPVGTPPPTPPATGAVHVGVGMVFDVM